MDGGGTASRSAAEQAGRIGAHTAEIARRTAEQGRQMVNERIDLTGGKLPWDSVLPEEARKSGLSAVESSRALSVDAKRKITTSAVAVLSDLFDKGMDSQAQILSILQGLLASSEGSALVNSWLQEMFSGRSSIYDKAMDATYNATRIGGGDHRLYDGGHSLVGAFQAAREASPDDNIFEEAAGLLQTLARDATTPKGLPIVTWDQDTFSGLTDSWQGRDT